MSFSCAVSKFSVVEVLDGLKTLRIFVASFFSTQLESSPRMSASSSLREFCFGNKIMRICLDLILE